MRARQAKVLLLRKIDSFIRDRIILADRVIEQHAIAKIKDGETILTYARSSVVEGVLLEAKRQGKSFSVVVVDSRPLYEGIIPGSSHLFELVHWADQGAFIIREKPFGCSECCRHSDNLRPSPITVGRFAADISLPSRDACSLVEWLHVFPRWYCHGRHDAHSARRASSMLLRDVQVFRASHARQYRRKRNGYVSTWNLLGPELTSLSIASPLSLLPGVKDGLPHLSPLSLLYDVSRPEDVKMIISEAGLSPVLVRLRQSFFAVLDLC